MAAMAAAISASTVGLTPTTPQDDAGLTIEPLVLVPMAAAHMLGCALSGAECYQTSMLVRAASLEDLPYLVDFVLAEAFEAEGRQLDRDQVQQAVSAALENPHLAQYWVLQEPTGRVVGAIAAVTEWSDWRNAAYWWIQFVFLQPEVRGRGHLSVLITELERVAQAQGAPELRLYVHPDNARAIRAYEKLGFAPFPYRVMMKALAPADGPELRPAVTPRST